jgi:hypothetical protein
MISFVKGKTEISPNLLVLIPQWLFVSAAVTTDLFY